MTATTNNATSTTANRPTTGQAGFHHAMAQAHGAKAAEDKPDSGKKPITKKPDATTTQAKNSGATDATPVPTKGADAQARPWTLNQTVGQPTDEPQTEPSGTGTEATPAGQVSGGSASTLDAKALSGGQRLGAGLTAKGTDGIAANATGQTEDGMDAATDADGVDTVDGVETQSVAVLDAGVSSTSDGVSADRPAASEVATMLGMVPVSTPVPSTVGAGFAGQPAVGLAGLAGLTSGLKANGATGVKATAAAPEASGTSKLKAAGVEVVPVFSPEGKQVEIASADPGSHRGQGATSEVGLEQMVQAVSGGTGSGMGSGMGAGAGSQPSTGNSSNTGANDAPVQTTASGVGAGWDGALQPGLQPAMSSAQLIQTMHQSEMRMGLNSEEFGNLSITTSISRKVLSAQIATEHAGLGRELASQMPAFQDQLGKAYGLQARVEVRDDSAGTQSSADASTSGGSQGGNAGAAAVARGGRMQFGPVKMGALNVAALAPGSFHSGNGRLDVRV